MLGLRCRAPLLSTLDCHEETALVAGACEGSGIAMILGASPSPDEFKALRAESNGGRLDELHALGAKLSLLQVIRIVSGIDALPI
ncbi:MAG: hypothetical protein NVS3B21_31100 [Acidimicrobiales bacterium]